MSAAATTRPGTVPDDAARLLGRRRNIGIKAHIDAGKTTVTERILFLSEKIHRFGEVHQGEATMDFLEEERDRGITIQSAATTVVWRDYQVNIIDTPGHVDFTAEVERSLRVLDGAIAVFDAVSGVEAQSETVWRQADRYEVPRICFINKMDRVGADYFAAMQSIVDRLGARPVTLQLPVGSEEGFRGIVDLVSRRLRVFDDASVGKSYHDLEIPDELTSDAELYRRELVETAAEFDDELLDLFLEDEDPPVDILKRAIRAGVLSREITPVLCGSALKHKGVRFVLDAVVDYLPNPADRPPVLGTCAKSEEPETRAAELDAPMCLMAFKTVTESTGDLTFVRVYSGIVEKGAKVLNPRTGRTERIGRIVRMHAKKRQAVDRICAGDIAAIVGLKNTATGDTLCSQEAPIHLSEIRFPEGVISMSIEPARGEDRDKLTEVIGRMTREDPTFRALTNEETGELVISGMGELHLEVIVNRIRKSNCNVRTGRPKVAYKQELTWDRELEIRYIRQTGGHGQYAVIEVRVGPGETEDGVFAFESEIRGGAIPREFIPAVKSGIREGVEGGGIAGYPFANVRAVLYDGKSHDVDSSDLAFHAAGVQAFREACRDNSTLLEPIMKIEVRCPEQFLGGVVGDLNSRRGEVSEIEVIGDLRVIRGTVPIAEMFAYSSALRGATQGRGSFSMELLHYRPAPERIAARVLAGE